MNEQYYTGGESLFPVPVRIVRSAYSSTIIESDYFYGQHSIHNSVFNDRVTPDYKVALSRILPKIDKQIAELEQQRAAMVVAIEQGGETIFGGEELKKTRKRLPEQLKNVDKAVNFLAFLNAVGEKV